MGQDPWVKMDDKLSDLTLGQVLEVLQDKGRDEDAEKYLFGLMMEALSHGLLPDEILSMTLDEYVSRRDAPPPGPPGWNTYWGNSVVRHSG